MTHKPPAGGFGAGTVLAIVAAIALAALLLGCATTSGDAGTAAGDPSRLPASPARGADADPRGPVVAPLPLPAFKLPPF